MLSKARPGNSIVIVPAHGSAGAGSETCSASGASGSAAMVTGTSAVTDLDLRGCRSPLSYCRFQRNT